MHIAFRILICIVVALVAVIAMTAIQETMGTKSNALVGGVGAISVFAAWWLTGKRSS